MFIKRVIDGKEVEIELTEKELAEISKDLGLEKACTVDELKNTGGNTNGK